MEGGRGQGHDCWNFASVSSETEACIWATRRLCNLLLNGFCTMQMKWQMHVSFSWFIPGFFHVQWVWGALREQIREGGDEGSGRASRAQKCRPQKNRRPEREPCLLWMQSKESPSDNGSFSVPVNDPLTDGKETVLCPRAIAVPKKKRGQKKSASSCICSISVLLWV